MNMGLKSTIWIATCICLLLMTSSNGYRILGVFVFPVRSHYFLGSSLLKGLAEAGHDVTMISPFSLKSLPENGTWNEIVINNIITTFGRNITFTKFYEKPVSQLWTEYISAYKDITETTLNDLKVQNLIHSDKKFDVVIVSEIMMISMKAFASHFDAHLITFSNSGGLNYYYGDLNVPYLPSHFPEFMIGDIYNGKLNYFNRIRNVYMWAVRFWLISIYESSHQADLVKKHFPKVHDLKDITRDTSLVLVNSHPSINYQQPKISMLVDIGGFHLKPSKKLPENLQTIVDNAENGVIYFSMGSQMKPEHLPKETLEVFLKVFAERKELILWKCPASILPGKSENVILGDWFPQQDILAHPNLKLFITHGGFLSMTETVYNGVPIIAIPLALDQKQNALFLADNGLGLNINLEDITQEILSDSIEDVILNPNYTKLAKERSFMLRDRIKSPMEEAIYWVEYVVRHNGAKHLRVPYLGMPWYQFYLLDIFAPFIVVIFVVTWLTTKTILFLLSLFKSFKKLKTL